MNIAMYRRSIWLIILALAAPCPTGAMAQPAAAQIAPPPAPAPGKPRLSRPKRIVSLNLCADQLLVALADRDQIAGLTSNAASPEMSSVAAQTKGLRILSSSAEEIVEIDPDLVIGMPARRSAALQMLKGRNLRTLDLETARSFDDIRASIRQTAAAVGHPARGEALIARMEADLARLPRSGQGRVAAYYQRRGFMTGAGTLVDDLMSRVGLVNLATRLDKPVLSQISLEELVAARPDFLIMESATARVTDQGTEMLHHPAIAHISRITIPEAWTVCGGPAYVLAAKSMAEQAARHR